MPTARPRPPRRTLRSACALLLAAACAAAGAFDLQGHRGARGHAPENTLAGFRAALAIGVGTLELDLGMSRDGVPVVAHDPRLNPELTRDAQGRWIEPPGPPLHQLTLAELQRYDVGRIKPGTPYAQSFAAQRPADGERMPTLDALLAALARWGAGAVRLNIELKVNPLEPALTPPPEDFVRSVLAVLERHGALARCTLQSFDWRVLAAARQQAPALATSALTVQGRLDNVADPRWTAGLRLADHGGSVPRLVKASGARIWSPFHGNLTPAALQEAQALGLQVIPWTVNEPADIERLLDAGVDGLISDYPDRVRAALARRGQPLPPPL